MARHFSLLQSHSHESALSVLSSHSLICKINQIRICLRVLALHFNGKFHSYQIHFLSAYRIHYANDTLPTEFILQATHPSRDSLSEQIISYGIHPLDDTPLIEFILRATHNLHKIHTWDDTLFKQFTLEHPCLYKKGPFPPKSSLLHNLPAPISGIVSNASSLVEHLLHVTSLHVNFPLTKPKTGSYCPALLSIMSIF